MGDKRVSYKDFYEKALLIIKGYSDRYEDLDPTIDEWKEIIENHTKEEIKEVLESKE